MLAFKSGVIWVIARNGARMFVRMDAVTVGCLIAALGLAVPTSGSESVSENWRLTPTGVFGGVPPSSSASYVLDASAAQTAPVGASSSTGWVLQSGFWSFAGTSLVPVWLTVDKNVRMAGSVDLSWSGNNAPYAIYEATDCSEVDASPLATTSANVYSNVVPPPAPLVCYLVQATAPGPAPLPNP